MARLLGAAFGIVLLSLAGGAYEGSGEEGRQSVTDQVARGQELYKLHCVRCHTEGGIGPELTPDALAPMGTARILFNFVRAAMPQDKPGTLKEDEYWDILAYVLSLSGVLPSGILLGTETADGIQLTK